MHLEKRMIIEHTGTLNSLLSKEVRIRPAYEKRYFCYFYLIAFASLQVTVNSYGEGTAF